MTLSISRSGLHALRKALPPPDALLRYSPWHLTALLCTAVLTDPDMLHAHYRLRYFQCWANSWTGQNGQSKILQKFCFRHYRQIWTRVTQKVLQLEVVNHSFFWESESNENCSFAHSSNSFTTIQKFPAGGLCIVSWYHTPLPIFLPFASFLFSRLLYHVLQLCALVTCPLVCDVSSDSASIQNAWLSGA